MANSASNSLPWWMDLCLAFPLAAFSELLMAGIREFMGDWALVGHLYADDVLPITILAGLLLLTMRFASRRSYPAKWMALLLLSVVEFVRAFAYNRSLM